MTDKRIPIALPSLGEQEVDSMRQTLLSGWVTQGPRVASFEREFASWTGAPHACAVSNCTAALHLALKAAGVEPGDAVLTVSHSFIATANAIRHCGAEPIFVDIDEDTLNLSPGRLVEAIDRDFEPRGNSHWYRHIERLATGESPWVGREARCGRLAAILVVHQLGMPADLASILPIAANWGIPVVEDAACAIGSETLWNGSWEQIGKPHGDVACFSFHPRKVITTGDGGMLTTRQPARDALFRLLRQHGMGTSDVRRHAATQVAFEEYLTTGFNYRLTDVQAALGCAQLARLPEIVERRRALASLYQEALAETSGLLLPHEPEYARSNWQSFAVRLTDQRLQRPLMQAMLDAGISTRRGVMCAHLERPYQAAWAKGTLPVSERMTNSCVILPLYPDLSDDDALRVAETLRSTMQLTSKPRSAARSSSASLVRPDDSPLDQHRYVWPREDFENVHGWRHSDGWWTRSMPESRAELAEDSRWPALFPSSLCIVSTGDGRQTALEKVVGASIVNRFPYTMALSFCARPLSARHHVRRSFMEIVESGGTVAVQFLAPGERLQRIMEEIAKSDEAGSNRRVLSSGLPTRSGRTVQAPVFQDAYLVYEGRLVKPGKDFEGRAIFPGHHRDVGSHRIYFFEITAIQLRRDIADGRTQIVWTSLPRWRPRRQAASSVAPPSISGYQKAYSPNYRFPSENTVAFEPDEISAGMAIKLLPPHLDGQLEVDDDRARWPCFFPSSVGMITTWDDDGSPNLMPCGSTTVVSRHPLVIAPCVSYAAINRRYAPRASLEMIRRRGKFGCGVAFLDDRLTQAIHYAGNVSLAADRHKVTNAGLTVRTSASSPVIEELPVHFDCEVIDELRLGTHVMFLGEVKKISVRDDVTSTTPLQWCPWADLVPRARAEAA
jgi:dTDP-4-amino-4,6-dideoxygalactose transaminase/flavin reductase (DIM6/NTAB) family NADH-FMN oxidoreductase RutF